MVNTSPAPSLEKQVFVLVVVVGLSYPACFNLPGVKAPPTAQLSGHHHQDNVIALEDNRESKIKIDDKGAFAVFQIGTLQQYIIARKRPKEEFLQRSIIRTDIFLNFWSQILACCHADEEA